MNQTLLLLRGLPGSGKTTLARKLSKHNICADECWSWDYTTDPRGFDLNELRAAHERCQDIVKTWLQEGVELIVVHNTFAKERDMKPYLDMGCAVAVATVENRHGGVSVHNVPEETVNKMRQGFKVCL